MTNRVVPDRYGVINIGKLKENLVTEVALPAPGFEGGSYAVLLRRPKEELPYPVSARHDGNSLVWTVQTADTAIAGMGKLECRWYGDNGEVAKSQTYMVRITDGLPDPTEAPEAWAGFMQQVSQDAGRAQSAADNAAKALKKLENGIASGDFRGEKGDKGDPGPQGPKGEAGPAGDTTAADAAAEAAKQAAQEAQKAAEASAGSAAQAAESVGGLADDLEATQKDIAKMKRAIKFQAELNKGQTWDFEVDTQEAYQRQVPSGAKAGAVMAVGGKTVVWNQCLSLKKGSIGSNLGASGMTIITYGDVTSSTIVQSLNANAFVLRRLLPEAYELVSNRMYLMLADLKYTTATTQIDVRFQHEGIAVTPVKKLMVTKTWQNLAFIAKMITTISSVFIYIDTSAKLLPGDTVELRNPHMVDLTLLYGPGNEPTDTSDPRIAKIEAYAAKHPEYNGGELVSAEVDSVVERGANLINIQALQEWWPNDTEVDGDILYVKKNSGGANGIVEKRFPISIPSGAVISAKGVKPQSNMVMSKNARISFVLANGQILECFLSDKYNTPKEVENVVASNDIIAAYLDYTTPDNFFGIANLMIRLPYASSTYSPYHQETYPIPSAVRNLPGYGWSAGNVSNTVERTENGWQYVQRVRSVDLGTLDWVAQKNVLYSSQYFASQSITHPTKAPAFLTAAYAMASSSNVVATDKSCWVSFNWGEDGRVIIRDDKYADAASFKSAMRGMLLYYELSDYITTDITALMGDSLAPFAVEAGGSITMHHPKADEGFAVDVPAKIQYITKLSEVSANG